MAYRNDYPPIEYLQRRMKYYKKRRGKIKGFLKRDSMMKRFTVEDIEEAVNHMVKRIAEYETAIEILKSHQ